MVKLVQTVVQMDSQWAPKIKQISSKTIKSAHQLRSCIHLGPRMVPRWPRDLILDDFGLHFERFVGVFSMLSLAIPCTLHSPKTHQQALPWLCPGVTVFSRVSLVRQCMLVSSVLSGPLCLYRFRKAPACRQLEVIYLGSPSGED